MAQNEPVVIVDDLHIDYKVYAAGSRVGDDRGGILHSQVGRKGIRTVHALRGVSLVARKNESIGIIGVNGSGKTTLMRALAGFLSPTSGTVYTSSQPSMLGVGAALMPQLSGAWNVVLGCLANGLSREQTNQEFHKIVEFSELGEFIDLPMRTYSSGMSARLRFSIAAARNQDILIVDEALAVGDQNFRVKSEARIREIREAAGTVFLVSHSMGSIRGTCSRAIWINDGLVEMDGSTTEVTKAYEATKKARAQAAPAVIPLGPTGAKPATPAPAPKPATPKPAAPKQAASKPAAPKPAASKPAAPKPTTPATKPATQTPKPPTPKPATATPKPAAPKPATPKPTAPKPTTSTQTAGEPSALKPTAAVAPSMPDLPDVLPGSDKPSGSDQLPGIQTIAPRRLADDEQNPITPTPPPTFPPPQPTLPTPPPTFPAAPPTFPTPPPTPTNEPFGLTQTTPMTPPMPGLAEMPPVGDQPFGSGQPLPTVQAITPRRLAGDEHDPIHPRAEQGESPFTPRRAV